jgi:hypothetical protein
VAATPASDPAVSITRDRFVATMRSYGRRIPASRPAGWGATGKLDDADRGERDVDDRDVVRRIGELADEEHELERTHIGTGLTDDDRARLHDIEVALDQCWDLLRQRRARRAAGQDVDQATVRPESTVEGYRQ